MSVGRSCPVHSRGGSSSSCWNHPGPPCISVMNDLVHQFRGGRQFFIMKNSESLSHGMFLNTLVVRTWCLQPQVQYIMRNEQQKLCQYFEIYHVSTLPFLQPSVVGASGEEVPRYWIDRPIPKVDTNTPEDEEFYQVGDSFLRVEMTSRQVVLEVGANKLWRRYMFSTTNGVWKSVVRTAAASSLSCLKIFDE